MAGAKTVADGLNPGDSVAVNGACLTVTEASRGSLTCDLSAETLQRTTFQGLREGARVNLERSLSVGSRLGGHFVLGHVDRVGKLLSSIPAGDGWLFSFEFPADLAPYLLKGSIAVDGISLTVASIAERSFAAAVIPYTFDHTNLGDLKTGDPVNLEVDILGKYAERFFRFGG